MVMAVPGSKAELLHAIAGNYDKLAGVLARVPAERAREASMPGHKAGRQMSPADLVAYLVAYLVGWNELVLSWHAQRAAGLEAQFPAPGYGWNELGDLAQRFYADHAYDSWPVLLEELASAKARIVGLIEEHDDAELYGVPWYGKFTAGRMIQFNTSSPYANARIRLRAWLRADDL